MCRGPNVHIHIFRKRWNLILGCFFPVIILKGKQDVPKVYGFSPFLRWIHPRKTENNAKNQKFPRNCILRYIELHKSQVPDES